VELEASLQFERGGEFEKGYSSGFWVCGFGFVGRRGLFRLIGEEADGGYVP
jgi:hypothetical protein